MIELLNNIYSSFCSFNIQFSAISPPTAPPPTTLSPTHPLLLTLHFIFIYFLIFNSNFFTFDFSFFYFFTFTFFSSSDGHPDGNGNGNGHLHTVNLHTMSDLDQRPSGKCQLFSFTDFLYMAILGDSVFWLSTVTLVIGFLVTGLTIMFKSKCKKFNCCICFYPDI